MHLVTSRKLNYCNLVFTSYQRYKERLERLQANLGGAGNEKNVNNEKLQEDEKNIVKHVEEPEEDYGIEIVKEESKDKRYICIFSAVACDTLFYAQRHVRSHVRASTHEITCTSEKSPVPTTLSPMQLHMPNRNFVVATATLVTVTLFFHNSALSCSALNETFDIYSLHQRINSFTVVYMLSYYNISNVPVEED